MRKYVFDLGTFDKSKDAFKAAVTIMNDIYRFPNIQGTETYSDMLIHPDGVMVAMDLLNDGDEDKLENGTVIDVLDASWDEAKVDTEASRDGTEKKPK